MSLPAIAQHMAAHGRNGDSMLVHMTPHEVAGLQKLAEKHGTSLTINPHTGLPEAFSLSSLAKAAIPVLAGAALGPAGFGLAETALGAATMVGGVSALASGNLSQGLMAGLGAYGGFGLSQGLMAAGEAAGADALSAANSTAASSLGPDANARDILMSRNASAANALMDKPLVSGIESLSTEAGRNAALQGMGGTTGALKYGAAAALPIMADKMTPTTTPMPKQEPSYIRQFSYNPYGQKYTAMAPVDASKWGSRSFEDAFKAADGGIVALAHGGAVRHFDDGGDTGYDPNTDYTQQIYNAPVPAAAPAAAPAVAVPAAPQYTSSQINDYIAQNKLSGDALTAAEKQFGVSHDQVTAAQNAQNAVQNVYENVLGRNADPNGLAYWTNQITSGAVKPEDMYQNFLNSAQINHELIHPGLSLEQATSPYTGYASADTRGIADEWAQNVLGRGLTAEDKAQQWYQQASDANVMNTYDVAQNIYGNFQKYAADVGAKTAAEKVALARQTIAAKGLTDADVYAQTGKTIEQLIGKPKTDLDIFHASQLLAPTNTAFDFASLKPRTSMPGAGGGVSDGSGHTFQTTPATYAPAGTTNPYGNAINPGDITINPDGSKTVTPNIPGRPYGGFTGIGQVAGAYTAGGGSLGYTPYVPKTAAEHAAMYGTQTGGSKAAYDYLMGQGAYPTNPVTPTGEVMKPYAQSVLGTPVDQTAPALIWDPVNRRYIPNPKYVKPLTQAEKDAAAKAAADAAAAKTTSATTASESSGAKAGGLMVLAGGGMSHLGDYSDGGRLLKGPGDGVSDSIPASIGNKQPARLADGEFVVPARIVSELGNGSTDAGARKLYQMMDRVQKARGKTTGKGKVATNSRADKYLPV